MSEDIKPLAWRRISNISNQSTGVFETQDVELRAERLEPLFGVDAINATYAAGVAAGLATPVSNGDGYFFVIHPDDPSIKLLPDGMTVILQRKVLSIAQK